jgi:glycosyltransferase involved in cell wall biosynthesis
MTKELSLRIAFFGDTNYVGTRDWIAHLARRADVDLHAIIFHGDREEMSGVRFHRLPRRLPRGKVRYFACVPALRRILAELSPDLLIAYRVVSYGFSASLTGFHPLALAAQGQYIISRETPGLLRYCARRAVRKADLIHSWAPPMTRSLEGLGSPPERILTLTRGVNLRMFDLGEEPPAPPTLLTTRQLEPYYNLPTLIEAVAEARKSMPGIRFRIAGVGSARAGLEDLVRKRGLLDVVTFLGTVNRVDLPALYKSAHLYVSAVPSDGTSSSLLEAMATGATPVVTDNESNRFWIEEGVGGRLVPAFDAAGFARAIKEAWEAPKWRSSVRERNRGVVEERASWDRNMARFTEAYKELASSGGKWNPLKTESSLESGR